MAEGKSIIMVKGFKGRGKIWRADEVGYGGRGSLLWKEEIYAMFPLSCARARTKARTAFLRAHKFGELLMLFGSEIFPSVYISGARCVEVNGTDPCSPMTVGQRLPKTMFAFFVSLSISHSRSLFALFLSLYVSVTRGERRTCT